MNKNHAFTFMSGKHIEDNCFHINVIIFLFITAIRLFIYVKVDTSDIDNFNIHFYALAGFIPYIIFTGIFPYTVFDKNYYRLSRFYQIPLTHTYAYFLSQIYSKKNLLFVILVPFIIEVLFFTLSNETTFIYPIVFLTGFLFSFTFASISFILTLFFEKIYLLLQIPIPIFLYFGTIILIFTSLTSFNWIYLVIVISLNLIVALSAYKLIQWRDAYMEV